MPNIAQEPPTRSTDGRLIYAVGDIHGNADLLEALLAEIARDALETRPASRPLLIFIGDYIDRGEASARVLDLVVAVSQASAFEVRALKGNHEEAMLKFLDDPAFGDTWVQFGGGQTLASYGVQPPLTDPDGRAWAAARDALEKALPRAHLEFLQNLELLVRVGDYAFVHAGLNPKESVDRQVEHDVLWIRGQFLTSEGDADYIVVHGHTPAEKAQFLPHRIGIDTGVYLTGRLTALRLLDDSRSLIQAQAEASAASRSDG